jgi:hypothetical protein
MYFYNRKMSSNMWGDTARIPIWLAENTNEGEGASHQRSVELTHYKARIAFGNLNIKCRKQNAYTCIDTFAIMFPVALGLPAAAGSS